MVRNALQLLAATSIGSLALIASAAATTSVAYNSSIFADGSESMTIDLNSPAPTTPIKASAGSASAT